MRLLQLLHLLRREEGPVDVLDRCLGRLQVLRIVLDRRQLLNRQLSPDLRLRRDRLQVRVRQPLLLELPLQLRKSFFFCSSVCRTSTALQRV